MSSRHSLPADWKTVRLSDIAYARLSGVDKNTCNDEETVLLCNYLDVYKHDYISEGMRFMQATARPEEISRLLLKPDDVIITKDSETWDDIAVPAYVKDVSDRLVCGYHLALITTDKASMSGRFLFCCLQSKAWRRQFEELAVGVTRYGISRDSILKALFPLPPITEQRKIAEILGSVDESIEKTQALIAKLQDLKKATMQELLTKGIGHTKFKDSPVGRIPEEWEVVSFINIVTLFVGGTPDTTRTEYWGGSIPWLSVMDFNNGHRWVFKAEKSITEKGLSESSTRLLRKGQLILSARGTVGVVAQVGADMAFNQSCYGIDARPNCTENDFVYYLLQHTLPDLKKISYGGAFDTITTDSFRNVHVELPPLFEQKRIAEIMGSLDESIETQRIRLSRISDIKKALMQDLLTGKVRVKT